MAEKMVSNEPKKKSGAGKVILAIILTLLIAGGGAAAGVYFLRQVEIDDLKGDHQRTTDGLKKQFSEVQEKMGNLENIQKDLEKKNADLEKQLKERESEEKDGVFAKNKVYVFPDGTELKESELIGDGETVKGRVAQDQNDPDMFYYFVETNLSREADEDGGITTGNVMYSYNKNNGDKKKEYSKELKNHDYWVLGTQGEKVIILKQPVDNSPHPCGSMWLMTTSTGEIDIGYYYYTPGEDQELSKYTVSDSKREKEKKEEKECDADLEEKTEQP